MLGGLVIGLIALIWFSWPAISKAFKEWRGSGQGEPADLEQTNYRVLLGVALAVGLGAALIAFHEFDLEIEYVSKSMQDQYMRAVEARRQMFAISSVVSIVAFLSAWRIYYRRARSLRQG